MTYPDPKYFGDHGERSAALRRVDAPAELPFPGGGASYLATGASTGGQFGLYRWDMGPDTPGPGTHFHRTISESFFVLSGTVNFYDGREWIDANTGDFLYVPEGGLHAFRNSSGAPASMLLLFVPGAPREAYFESLGRLGEMSADELAAFFVEHDTYWV